MAYGLACCVGNLFVPCGYQHYVPICGGGGGPIVATVVSGTSGTSVESFDLRASSTYHVVYTMTHATTSFDCGLSIQMTAGGASIFGILDNAPTTVDTYEFDVSIDGVGGGLPAGCYSAHIFEGVGYAGCNVIGSSVSVVITDVSGSDPRFVRYPECDPSQDTPMAGQGVIEAIIADGTTDTFTTNFPYRTNRITALVDNAYTPIEPYGAGWGAGPTLISGSVGGQGSASAGEVTLPSIPAAGAEVIFLYTAQGRPATASRNPLPAIDADRVLTGLGSRTVIGTTTDPSTGWAQLRYLWAYAPPT